MVVVVGRVVEAVPPHGGPGGRLYQPAVAPAQSRAEEREEKYEEHLATVCSLHSLSQFISSLHVSFPCNSLIIICFILLLKMYSSVRFYETAS